jgi:glycosyltransferase involved in cell wall biosynthesis
MLGAWAMNRGKAKKRLAWWLYQRSDLANATAFHATSQQEADDIRSLGFRQAIAVIPNGVDFPDPMPERKSTDVRQMLFMSRIHPKKGLLNLLRAWKQAEINSDWRLVLAGPDENGHRAQVERESQRLGLNGQVSFTGPVDDHDKWQLLVNSDVFVLPSFSENFGIVIAEAMAAGLPVITTTATPWQVLAEKQMGWCVAPSVEELSAALRRATNVSTSEVREMGGRAKRHALDSFDWSHIASQMREFYESIAAHHAPATCR